jgi:hypothetical protein
MIRRSIAALLLLAAVPVQAQTPAAQTLPAVRPAASDTASIWSIQGENSSISSNRITDRFYTNGLRLGWTSPEGQVPDFLARTGRLLWGAAGQQRIAVDVTQQIYTPYNTAARASVRGDRPYAGTLMVNASLMQDTADWRSVVGLGIGVMGPLALGEQVQNGFHDLIQQGRINGWRSQLKNEPVVQLLSERTWRLAITKFAGLEVDALPDLTAAVGSLRIYAQTGVTFRIGQGLDSDFGVAKIRPGQTGGDAYKPTRPFAWYIFAGADGRAVLRDGTLEGNLYHRSASVKKQPFVGELQAGVALMAWGMRLSYAHTLQTQEFRKQKGGLHQFGSLNAAVRF